MQKRVYAKNGQKKSRNRVARLYLDYAAATPVAPAVLRAMAPYWSANFGNPSSIAGEGVFARRAVEEARASVAQLVGALPDEIIFTSGGTESNNLAIRGVLERNPKGHVFASTVEHPSVLEPIRAFEARGGAVSWIPVDAQGRIDLKAAGALVHRDTVLVSVMYANNEVGAIQPIQEIARAVRRERKARDPKDPFGIRAPFFHVDACQAPGLLPIDLARIGADLASFSAQKFYGPKGAGFLYVRRGVGLAPQVLGGGHEGGSRAGTENVPAVLGMAAALFEAEKCRAGLVARLSNVKSEFLYELQRAVPDSVLNGASELSLPSNIHVSFPGIPSEVMVLGLDALGISVSAGSACGTRDAEPSYVLRAMGLPPERIESGIRITLGRKTSARDLRRLIRGIKKVHDRQSRFSVSSAVVQ